MRIRTSFALKNLNVLIKHRYSERSLKAENESERERVRVSERVRESLRRTKGEHTHARGRTRKLRAEHLCISRRTNRLLSMTIRKEVNKEC